MEGGGKEGLRLLDDRECPRVDAAQRNEAEDVHHKVQEGGDYNEMIVTPRVGAGDGGEMEGEGGRWWWWGEIARTSHLGGGEQEGAQPEANVREAAGGRGRL